MATEIAGGAIIPDPPRGLGCKGGFCDRRSDCLDAACCLYKSSAEEARDVRAAEIAASALQQPCCERDHDLDGNCDRHPAADAKPPNPKDQVGDKKVPLWLCSAVAKAHWALGQFAGMLKYGAWNWRETGVRSSVYLSAMDRHMDAYKSGEEFDPIDGTHHLGNIMACCAILLDAKAAGKLTDDRPPVLGIRDTYQFVEERMEVLCQMYADRKPVHYTIERIR